MMTSYRFRRKPAVPAAPASTAPCTCGFTPREPYPSRNESNPTLRFPSPERTGAGVRVQCTDDPVHNGTGRAHAAEPPEKASQQVTEPKPEAQYTFRRRGGDRIPFDVQVYANIVKGAILGLSRRNWSGMEHVPLDGPAILVWNHYSDIDPILVVHYVYNAGRHPRFLLKESIVRVPVVGAILKRSGQIPVKRGSAEAADSLRILREQLAAGHVVIMAPEGTVTKEPDRWPMRGKTGVARLALESGAPVVPIVQWGALGIHDRNRDPKFKLGRKPVTVRAFPPVDLSPWLGKEPSREDLVEVSDAIMEALRAGLAEVRGQEAPPLYDPRQQRPEESESSE
jgi:1-acyl-sn-glycerol-3-phosphate acyltransferase